MQTESPLLDAIVQWLKEVQNATREKKSASCAANLRLGVLWEELKRQHPDLSTSYIMAILTGEVVSSSYDNLDMHLSHWDAEVIEKVKENINNSAILSVRNRGLLLIVAELAAHKFVRAHKRRKWAVPGNPESQPPVPPDPEAGFSKVETTPEDAQNDILFQPERTRTSARMF